MNPENKSFFDPKTIMAILLVAVFWIGWQSYMAKKYPEAFKPPEVAKSESALPAATPSEAGSKDPDAKQAPADVSVGKRDELSDVSKPESFLVFKSENLNFEVSSKGMGLKNIQLNNYTDREEVPILFQSPESASLPYSTALVGSVEPIHFALEQINPNTIVGRAQVRGLSITKVLEIESERYLIRSKISVVGTDEAFLGLTNFLSDTLGEYGAPSFFVPSFDHQEFFIVSGEGESRVPINKEEAHSEDFNKVTSLALGSQYFTMGYIDKSPLIPRVRAIVDPKSGLAEARVSYEVLNRSGEFNLEFLAFVGPKYLDLLRSADEALAGVINYGFFGWLARPILRLMNTIHSVVPNWGIAIILLTIIVRIMVLPFNVLSYRSMKRMQVIQPKLKEIREKFKGDTQKINEATMNLMRTEKVNPLGGCLPMLLQIPVFFALFQVLGQSIELYKAPFGMWISDLSLKDPFFVLPVLVAAGMFLHQKITPNTMEPAQARMMLFMPIIFAIPMASFPSGLNLYIAVSTAFGILQHLYFMRDTKTLKPTTT